jgi:uncharacterized protein (DUF1499 family)
MGHLRMLCCMKSVYPPVPRRAMGRWLLWSLPVVVAAVVWSRGRHQSAARGHAEGTLQGCGDRPNCVSSQDERPSHSIHPLTCNVPPTEALDGLINLLTRLPGVRLRARTDDGYAHLTFTTRWLRFIDDVELLAVDGSRTIEIRSSSRVGYGDLGMNRRRVESIRALGRTHGILQDASHGDPQSP